MKFGWFLPACILVLMLALTAIGVMGMLGYPLIEFAVVFILFGLLITLCLGALAVWLTRKIRKKGARLLIGTAGALAVSTLALLMIVFFSFVGSFYMPEQYTLLESESGRKVVVMRRISQEHAIERSNARMDGESAIHYDDLGYQYQIYPVFSKFFYNSKQSAEGSLEIGCASQAQLMHSWDGDSLRLYIGNPEEFDSGELILR